MPKGSRSTAESVYVLGASALAKGQARLEMIHEKQASKNMVSFASNAETTPHVHLTKDLPVFIYIELLARLELEETKARDRKPSGISSG